METIGGEICGEKPHAQNTARELSKQPKTPGGVSEDFTGKGKKSCWPPNATFDQQ